MVGICHGGNVPVSHDDGDVDVDGDGDDETISEHQERSRLKPTEG